MRSQEMLAELESRRKDIELSMALKRKEAAETASRKAEEAAAEAASSKEAVDKGKTEKHRKNKDGVGKKDGAIDEDAFVGEGSGDGSETERRTKTRTIARDA